MVKRDSSSAQEIRSGCYHDGLDFTSRAWIVKESRTFVLWFSDFDALEVFSDNVAPWGKRRH
jgi:hypothetical protein